MAAKPYRNPIPLGLEQGGSLSSVSDKAWGSLKGEMAGLFSGTSVCKDPSSALAVAPLHPAPKEPPGVPWTPGSTQRARAPALPLPVSHLSAWSRSGSSVPSCSCRPRGTRPSAGPQAKASSRQHASTSLSPREPIFLPVPAGNTLGLERALQRSKPELWPDPRNQNAPATSASARATPHTYTHTHTLPHLLCTCIHVRSRPLALTHVRVCVLSTRAQ